MNQVRQITLTVEQCRLLLDWSKTNREADLSEFSPDTPTLIRMRKNWKKIIDQLKVAVYAEPKKVK